MPFRRTDWPRVAILVEDSRWLPSARRFLLHHHGVGADGEGGAGEDADALVVLHHAGEAGAGLRGTGEEQRLAGDDVAGAHGVAIHGAGVEGRLGVLGEERARAGRGLWARARGRFRAAASGCA